MSFETFKITRTNSARRSSTPRALPIHNTLPERRGVKEKKNFQPQRDEATNSGTSRIQRKELGQGEFRRKQGEIKEPLGAAKQMRSETEIER